MRVWTPDPLYIDSRWSCVQKVELRPIAVPSYHFYFKIAWDGLGSYNHVKIMRETRIDPQDKKQVKKQ